MPNVPDSQNSIPLKDTYRYITQVARMVTYFEPLKVFLPMSISLIGIGSISSAVNLWRTGTMQEMDMMIALGGFLVGVLGLIADLFVQYQRKLERLISSLPQTGREVEFILGYAPRILSQQDRDRDF